MKQIILSVLMLSLAFCQQAISKTDAPSHKDWTKILKKHVNDNGLVNYKGIIKDKKDFEAYLKLIGDNEPQKSWSADEKEAYWINAYNAFTIKLIIDHYPVKSIKDIGPKNQVPFVNTPWQKKFIKIGSKTMKLDEIEHQILRKDFDDPRIHFAVVCASISCAKLRNEAYEADKLDKQLDDQAKDFLSDKSKNVITADKLKLSKYFDWYKKDFTKNGNLIDYLNKYAPVKINKSPGITYNNYNWGLNEQ